MIVGADGLGRYYRLRQDLLAGRNALPEVRLVRPTPGSAAPVPVSTTLEAAATDADGTVRSVEFFVNGRSLGVDASPPYTMGWVQTTAGVFEIFARATDDIGAMARSESLTFQAFDPAQPPPTTFVSSPTVGATDVAVTRETVLRFSAPLAGSPVPGPDTVFASHGDRRLLSRLELGSDRRTLTVFYLEPMPGSARVRLTVKGDALRDERGFAVDGDGDGRYGGTGFVDFDTVSLTPMGETAVYGRVFASELKPVPGRANEFVNDPLGGVTITVDGREETLRAVTDAQGNFRLSPVPAGPFFVHIDGRTVANDAVGIRYPNLAYYPNVGKKWEARAGQETMQEAIYLPLIPKGTLQPVKTDAVTTLSFSSEFVAANPQFDGVAIRVPPNSLYGENGVRGGKVGIAPVPPDRLPQPLPLGLEIQDVITIQTDGGLNFAEPVPACFPNLPDPATGQPLPPGAKSALWSFNHDTGRFEIVGSATVSADGRLVCTDPGVGIIAPGWHGTREGTQGRGGPILNPGSSPDGSPTPPPEGGSPEPDPGPKPQPRGPGPAPRPDDIHQPPGPDDSYPQAAPRGRGPRGDGDRNRNRDRDHRGPDTSDDDALPPDGPPVPDSKGGGGGGGGGGNKDKEDKEDEDPDACPTGGTSGKPVNLATGEEQLSVVDLVVPGRGLDFVWSRTYRSRTGTYTRMGRNWTHSYDVGLYAEGTDLVLLDGTGRRDLYRLQPGGFYQRAEFFRRIEREDDGSLTVRFENQGRWNFFPLVGDARDGRLRELADRNGNRLRFAYDSAGRMTNIVDTLDRSMRVAYHPDGTIATVTDHLGRQVRYEYYRDGDSEGGAGDLKSVTTPSVAVAVAGNTFPNGKTRTYTYTRGFRDDRLNHNLLTVIDAAGQEYLRNTYAATTHPDDLLFDRVIRQSWGYTNEVMDFVYVALASPRDLPSAVLKTVVNDRVGNVSEHFFDAGNRLLALRQFTGRADPRLPTTEVSNRPRNPLRPNDPAYFETRYDYNSDSQVRRIWHPNGNQSEFVYESDLDPQAEPETRGNLRLVRRSPGTHVPAGDWPVIEERYEYASGLGGCCGGGFNFITRHVDGRGNEIVHRYDERGNRTNTVDRIAGVVHDFEYNAFGQMTARIWPDDGSGRRRRDEFTYHTTGHQRGYWAATAIDAGRLALTHRFEYDAAGRRTRIVDPNGHAIEVLYNELDRRVRVTLPEFRPGSGLRYVTEFRYDANDNVVRMDATNADEVGVVADNPLLTTLYEYEILNRIVASSIEVESNRVIRLEYEYDANRNQTLIRQGEAVAGRQSESVSAFLFDERDLLYRHVRSPGSAAQSTLQMDYDGNANPRHLWSGLEQAPRLRTFVYDGYNRTVETTDALGNRTLRRFDPDGNRISLRTEGELLDVPGTNANLRLSEVHFRFDALDRLTRTDAAFFDPASQAPIDDGFVTQRFEYSPASLTLRVIDDRGQVSENRYDTAHRLVEELDALGNRTLSRYDNASDLVRVESVERSGTGGAEERFVTTFEYDPLHRLIRTTDPVGNVRSFGYDAQNHLVRHVDPRGNVQKLRYDGLGRLLESERVLTDTGEGAGRPAGSIRTRMTWDDNSRLVRRTDPLGNVTEYRYDPLDREIESVRADGSVTRLEYDVHDNVVRRTDPNGTVRKTAYDALDREIRNDFVPGTGVANDTSFEVFAYDGTGRLVSADNDVTQVRRAYDSLSHLVRETQGAAVIEAGYDGLGNQIARLAPSGQLVTAKYDALDRLELLSDDQGVVASFTYDGPSSLRQQVYRNGTRTDFAYDGLRRVSEVVHVRSPFGGADRFGSLTLGWSSTSQKTRRDLVSVGGARRELVYDSADRMVRSVTTPPAGVPQEEVKYVLDLAGNRVRVEGGAHAGAYVLDSSVPQPADAQVHQYSRTPEGARNHDANGNPISAAGLGTLRFDVHNRLVGFAGASETATYSYDALGRRIDKTVRRLPAGEETLRFFYDGWRVVEERNGQGATLATYLHGEGLDEILAMDRNGQRLYFHADDQGSVTHLTDASGNVVEGYDYADYGEPFYRVAGAIDTGNRWLFTGRYYDAETGLYEFRNRYLDPVSGRFLTRDPAGDWQDLGNFGNPFTYVGNSPWTRLDPLGLDGWETAREVGRAYLYGTGMMIRDGAVWAGWRMDETGRTVDRSVRAAGYHVGVRGVGGTTHDVIVAGGDKIMSTSDSVSSKVIKTGADLVENNPVTRIQDVGRRAQHRANQSHGRGNDPADAAYWLRQNWGSLSKEYLFEINKLAGHADIQAELATWAQREHMYNQFKKNPTKFLRDHGEKFFKEKAKDWADEKTKGKAKGKVKSSCKKAMQDLAPHLYNELF